MYQYITLHFDYSSIFASCTKGGSFMCTHLIRFNFHFETSIIILISSFLRDIMKFFQYSWAKKLTIWILKNIKKCKKIEYQIKMQPNNWFVFRSVTRPIDYIRYYKSFLQFHHFWGPRFYDILINKFNLDSIFPE